MKIEFDPAKDATNRRKHGVSLAEAIDFDLESAFVISDDGMTTVNPAIEPTA